jgi:argonaute-like protein implicated in RNA metabolism and viral defense
MISKTISMHKKKIYIGIFSGFVLFLIIIYLFATHISYDKALKHHSQEIHKDIISKLKNTNISHKIDKGGFILYKSNDEEKIEDIVKQVEQIHSPDLPNVSFTNRNHKEYFIKLLKNANIPFQIKNLDASNDEYIVWNWEYDDKVQKLKAILYEKITKEENKK